MAYCTTDSDCSLFAVFACVLCKLCVCVCVCMCVCVCVCVYVCVHIVNHIDRIQCPLYQEISTSQN